MDKRTIIGMLVCVIFYIGYTVMLQKKYPDYGKPVPKQETAETTSEKEASPELVAKIIASEERKIAVPAAGKPQIAQLSTEQLTLENDVLTLKFNQDDAAIRSLVLKKYKDDAKKKEDRRPVDLAKEPFYLQPSIKNDQTLPVSGFSAERTSDRSIRFFITEGDWEKSIQYTLKPDSYKVEAETSYKNVSGSTKELVAALYGSQSHIVAKSGFSLVPNIASQYERVIVGVDGNRDGEAVQGYCEQEESEDALSGDNSKLDFLGFDHHYFLKVLSPESDSVNFKLRKEKPASAGQYCRLITNIWQPQGQVKAGERASMKYEAFFGPKDVDVLAKENPRLKETMDLGWFSLVGRPLLVVIKALYEVTHNYGIAIILLTLALKILFYPLTKSAAVSMKRMQLYTPEINRIKEKYKDDKQAQQREMMTFLAKHKINPMKGCLPILPQIPVFVAFYNVLSQSIELRHAPFYGWIQDLSAADPYFVTPILLGFGMVLQQKLSPNPTMDKTQEKIMLMVPIIFTFMMLTLPAGMVLYMITNTIVSILQQQWLNRHLKVQTANI